MLYALAPQPSVNWEQPPTPARSASVPARDWSDPDVADGDPRGPGRARRIWRRMAEVGARGRRLRRHRAGQSRGAARPGRAAAGRPARRAGTAARPAGRRVPPGARSARRLVRRPGLRRRSRHLRIRRRCQRSTGRCDRPSGLDRTPVGRHCVRATAHRPGPDLPRRPRPGRAGRRRPHPRRRPRAGRRPRSGRWARPTAPAAAQLGVALLAAAAVIVGGQRARARPAAGGLARTRERWPASSRCTPGSPSAHRRPRPPPRCCPAPCVPVAIYAILRMLFDPAGAAPPSWWGLPLLVLGAASVFTGGLDATRRADIDTALAAGTVRQTGLTAIGLGIALTARAADLPAVTAMALAAVLLLAAFRRSAARCCRWPREPSGMAPAPADSTGSAAWCTACRSPPPACWPACSGSPRCLRARASPRFGCCSRPCSPCPAPEARPSSFCSAPWQPCWGWRGACLGQPAAPGRRGLPRPPANTPRSRR